MLDGLLTNESARSRVFFRQSKLRIRPVLRNPARGKDLQDSAVHALFKPDAPEKPALRLYLPPDLSRKPMLPALQKSFNRLESSRFHLLQLTSALTEAQAHASPGPSEWSVVQVIEHMVTIERMVLRAVQKQLTKSTLQNSGVGTMARFTLLVLALRYRKKIKAPAILPHPAGDQSLDEWRHEWESTRQGWRQLLENVPEKVLRKEVFKHPLAGYLTLRQTLGFITEHHNHHVPQVQRLVKAA